MAKTANSKTRAAERPNIVCVVVDTLRKDHLGCYGNGAIRTPEIDAFARRGVRFTRAFPEVLPTIPARRSIHTGRRVFPMRDYRPLRWDLVRLPGWQPLDAEEDSVGENLAVAHPFRNGKFLDYNPQGYQTGFFVDTLPYFAPGYNFHRGYWQWEYIRGQMNDKLHSPYAIPKKTLADCYDPYRSIERGNYHSTVPLYLANRARVRDGEETTTARLFQRAMEFVEENRGEPPFFLFVDSFSPHEPWEAPEEYRRLYGKRNYKGRRIPIPPYGASPDLSEPEKEEIRAHYAGLVTLVDEWFGKLFRKIEEGGLLDRTAIILIADHGTNLWDNPPGVVGKPEDSMYPGLMNVPLIVRLPDEAGAGREVDAFTYNVDVAATIYELAGARSEQGTDGRSLLPLIRGTRAAASPREYVTCRYGHHLFYADDRNWVIADIDGNLKSCFDLEADPSCRRNLAPAADRKIIRRAWNALLQDAGGSFPDYRGAAESDALGRGGEKA